MPLIRSISFGYKKTLYVQVYYNASIRSKGSSVVPEVHFEEIEANGGRFPAASAEQIRKRGCVIVRGVLAKVMN